MNVAFRAMIELLNSRRPLPLAATLCRRRRRCCAPQTRLRGPLQAPSSAGNQFTESPGSFACPGRGPARPQTLYNRAVLEDKTIQGS